MNRMLLRTGDVANGQGRNTAGCLRLLQNLPVAQSSKVRLNPKPYTLNPKP